MLMEQSDTEKIRIRKEQARKEMQGRIARETGEWCCRECCAAGVQLTGHTYCWPRHGCGRRDHGPTTHGTL